MSNVINGRMSGSSDLDEFVVFLIGARVNNLWKVSSWLPVARAMTRMLRELAAKPELGMLGSETGFGRTSLMVQYWKSMQHLTDYARARDSEHLPAWREFNRRIAATTDVGIYHETYIVKPGNYETFYNNMPPFGLGKVGRLTPMGRPGKSMETAAERLLVNAER